MIDAISLPGLLVALILPWLCGGIWTNALLRRTGRCNVFVVLGLGYFLGLFVTTLVIRLWDVAGFDLSFWGIAAVLSLTGVLGILLGVRRPETVSPQTTKDVIPGWHIALGTVLIMLIAWRYVTLLQELLLRPLFAWDAWMNWAPKAIAWFHYGGLVDYVSPSQWLLAEMPEAYTLGNPQATPYPITVPLIMLWSMLGAGTWDHGAIYLPWLLAPLALGLGLFGHLRLAGVPFLLALVAVYLLLSIPFLNVHSALAGYADIWVAAVFGLAVCALYEWRRCRHWAYGLVWLVLALMCSQLKVPGIVLGLIVLFFGILGWLNFSAKQELGALVAGAILVAAVLLIDISLNIPYVGQVTLADGVITMGSVGHFRLEYHDVTAPLFNTLFVMMNWNMLWYLLPLFLFYCCLPRNSSRQLISDFLPVFAALVFLAIAFIFTDRYKTVLNFNTVNRALLYLVPAMVFCFFLSFQKRESGSG